MDDYQPNAEAKMRESLGLSDAAKPSLAADPQRLARQAIRSQATAREYVERQLLRAEQMNQDLGTKLQVVRREKGAALEAAHTAQTALIQTERDLRAAEAALVGEKALRERVQREAQEARATVQDLRAKLMQAHQTMDALRAQLDQERQTRTAAEEERPTIRELAAGGEPGEPPVDQPVKRRRGRRPGKRNALAPRPVPGTSRADAQAPVQWWIKGWGSRP